MPDGELVNPTLPAFYDVLFSLVPLLIVLPLAVLFVGALVSIHRRSTSMTGLEELGWYALVVFAQLIGPLVWFLLARDRYDQGHGLPATAPARQGDQAQGVR